jgi:hypothetical protein
MAVDRSGRGGIGGISVGGILVIVGIVVAIIWSLWLGILRRLRAREVVLARAVRAR